MRPLLETRQVTKRFGDLVAVDSVTLRVHPGEIVGLIGANGAGKTTLIRLILGLLPPTAGRIDLFGAPPRPEARARVGYVPQTTGSYLDLTVAENLRFVAAAFGTTPPVLDPELRAVADRPLGELPLGIRRKVAFAAAVCHHPDLLILDEPTSGVGPLGRVELWGAIGEVAARGAGVLVTTHHMEEAEQCDRIVLLSAGRVVADGTPAEVTGHVTAVEVSAPQWEPVFRRLREAGFRPLLAGSRLRVAGVDADEITRLAGPGADVRPTSPTLEEAFVALVSR
ncbi:MAG: hypothetical protein KatS3mg011_1678 [Acidimicrobiia bacterium]|nr:MAG: hypothetical protein KatS3mg011_1678 [Acidimicrobiia bacterium]